MEGEVGEGEVGEGEGEVGEGKVGEGEVGEGEVGEGEPAAPCSTEDFCGVAGSTCALRANNGFFCSCPAGYRASGNNALCLDINECTAQPTRCGSAPGTTCDNFDGGFECSCAEGFENGRGASGSDPTRNACQDTDECADPEFCQAICQNTAGFAACVSTVADPESPYWNYACRDNPESLANPTHFEMDCRCANQVGRPDRPRDGIIDPEYEQFNRCQSVSSMAIAGKTIGTGTSVREWRRLYNAFVGSTNYNGGFRDDATRNVEIRPPSLLSGSFPAEMERITYKALAKDRDQRYQ